MDWSANRAWLIAGGMNAKKKKSPDRRLFLVHLVRIAAPRRKQKPWLETRRTLTMSRVAPLKRNVKETISAEWGARAGAGAVSSLFVGPLGLIWSSGPSPRSATVIEVTLRQHLMKKKKFSTICLHFPRSEKKNNRLFSNWIIYFGKQSILPSQTPMLNWLLCPACSGTALFRGGGEG